MDYPIKQSHFYSAALFGASLLWFGALQTGRAATGLITWSEIPALLTMAVLFCGLLAIAFNFVWLQVLQEQGKSTEEPEDYKPSARVLLSIGAVLTIVACIGLVQGVVGVGVQS